MLVIRRASAISGHDQNAFLRSWLYGIKTPPVPGHPDWKVKPVGSHADRLTSTLSWSPVA
jgi:hypothetical protein